MTLAQAFDLVADRHPRVAWVAFVGGRDDDNTAALLAATSRPRRRESGCG